MNIVYSTLIICITALAGWLLNRLLKAEYKAGYNDGHNSGYQDGYRAKSRKPTLDQETNISAMPAIKEVAKFVKENNLPIRTDN